MSKGRAQLERAVRPVDGLVIGGKEVWVLVAGKREDLDELLEADGATLRVCRAILEGGVLVLGDADPDRDPLLSDLMAHREGVGRA